MGTKNKLGFALLKFLGEMKVKNLLFLMIINIYAQEIVLNDDTTGNNLLQRMGTLTATGNNRFVCAWVDHGNENPDIYFQIYDSFGTPITSPVKVGTDYTNKGQMSPALASLGNNKFIITWTDMRVGGTSRIFAQIFNTNGESIISDFIVNDDTTWNGYENRALVTSLENGDFVIAWYRTWNLPSLCYRVFDSLANPVTPVIKVIPDTLYSVNISKPFTIFPIKGDTFGIVYLASSESPFSRWGSVYLQRFFRDTTIGDPLLLYERTGWPNYFNQLHSISLLDGRIIISYQKNHSYQILHVLDTTGLPVDTPFVVPVDSLYSGFIWSTTLLSLPDTGFVALWIEFADTNRIIGQKFNKGLSPVNNNQILSGGGEAIVLAPIYADLISNNIVILWDAYGKNGENTWARDIYFQIFNTDLIPITESQRVWEPENANLQTTPAVRAHPGTGFVTVWRDARNPGIEEDSYGGNSDIYFQRLDSIGNPLGSNININVDSSLFQEQRVPDVAVLPNGYIGIIWEEWYENGILWYYDLYFQVFNIDGTPISPPFAVDIGPYELFYGTAKISTLYSNRFVITWYIDSLYFQVFDSLGNPVSPPTSFFSSLWFSGPFVFPFPDSGFGLVWKSGGHIYFQRFDSNYLPVDSSQRVTDTSTVVKRCEPVAALLPNGNYVIVWEGGRNEEIGWWEFPTDIYLQGFDSLGNPIGGNYRVNDDPFGNIQAFPSIAVNPLTGKFIISWTDTRNPDGDVDIYAQVFTQDFQPIGINRQINLDLSPPSTQITGPRSTAGNEKGVLFVWEDTRRHLRSDIIASFIPWDDLIRIEENPRIIYSLNSDILFNPRDFSIKFYLPKKGNVSLWLIDVSGRVIYKKEKLLLNRGIQIFRFPYRNFPAGIYFLRLKHSRSIFLEKFYYLNP